MVRPRRRADPVGRVAGAGTCSSGRADALRLGGRSEALYSPDAFGHPAVWPTLAAQFGIPFGALWRGVGGEPGQDGDLYRWRGPDGSEVLVYHLPPAGYEVGASLPSEWDAGRARCSPAAPRHRTSPSSSARTTTRCIPISAGSAESLAALEPDAEVRVSRLDEFLAEAARWADRCPSLSGELRWSYGYTWTLQGVHGTRAPLKRRHAEAELYLERVTEPLAALLQLRDGAAPGALLDEAWRTLLRCQFHDSIAGCTSDAVARRVESSHRGCSNHRHPSGAVGLRGTDRVLDRTPLAIIRRQRHRN